MENQEYLKVKNWANWELENAKKALEMLGGFFNTEEDNQRLEAIKKVLKERFKK